MSTSGESCAQSQGPTVKQKVKVGHESTWEEIAALASSTLMPQLPHPIDGSNTSAAGNEEFCRNHATLATTNLEKILELFKTIGKSQCAMRKHVIPLFLLLGEQEDGHKWPWSCPKNEGLVWQIIKEFYRIFDMDMDAAESSSADSCALLLLSPFFIRDFDSIGTPVKTVFAHIMKSFRTTLGARGTEWKSYPAKRVSYYWILMQVKYPYLTDHIEGTLLPALNFFDDFESENVIFGIHCISHILDNVIKSTIKNCGWGQLLHKSFMESLLFQKDPAVIDKIIPELMKVLKIIELDPSMYPDQMTQYDVTLEKLLDTFEISADDGANKNVWLKHLTTYVDVMGHGTMHWIDRILRILLDNTTCADPSRWLNILKCCKVCIASTWTKPQSWRFYEIILRIIYNTVEVDCSHFTKITKDSETKVISDIFETTLQCLELLHHNSDYEEIREQVEQFHLVGQGKLPDKFLQAWCSLFVLSSRK